MDLGENQTLAILGGLCWEANASKPTGVNTNSLKAALVIIEALVQRKESEILLKLGGISWRGHENSPVSLRCLQAALDLGPLDELYDYVQRWPKDSSSPELQKKKKEFGATVIIQIAERGCSDAFFCAAELLRDGDGCLADTRAARMYFYRFAVRATLESTSNLKLASEAFSELMKLTEAQRSDLLNFYSTMAETCSTASKQLSPMVPGEEFEIILGLPESGALEFKSTARWNIREQKESSEIEHEVVKTISAFLNTAGVILVIGIGPNDPKNELIGLEPDYRTLRKQDQDGFRLFLGDLIKCKIGEPLSLLVRISIVPFQGKEFCRVDVQKSKELIFGKWKGQECLYVRIDNQTQRLTEPSKIEAWRRQRDALV